MQGLWAMTENILNMAVLAPGLDDGGGAGANNPDYTQVFEYLSAHAMSSSDARIHTDMRLAPQVSIIRDHVALVYYFRSPATPQWQALDLNRLNATASPNASLITIPVSHGSQRPWFTDVSDTLTARHAEV